MSESGDRRFVTEYTRDYYGGALMLLIGLGAVVQGMQYGVGTVTHMQSGFFPVALGCVLALLGLVIAAGARKNAAGPQEEVLPPEWRGWICITLGILAFLVLGRYGGLVPATFAIVFVSALGDRDNTVRSAFLLAIAICAIAVVLFWWALKLPFPLFSWG
ncbi:tripartite tricarboxylate transporter TctB family protein [Paraburkholderia sp. J41]|uniref:tripartite tricarboxylate transporter TctB family protein n=1 Tax=Paraburkholderia sp. J41 TaxID=2805433 RepID=UPI002AC362E7|nr:tripartite tricarboxylate transporter TctB family protein [Paraburkholderia sp. J41]